MYDFNEYSDVNTLYYLINNNPLFREKIRKYLSHIKLLNYNGEYMTNKADFYPQIFRNSYIHDLERLIDLDYFITSFELNLPKANEYDYYKLDEIPKSGIMQDTIKNNICSMQVVKSGHNNSTYLQCPKYYKPLVLNSLHVEHVVSSEKIIKNAKFNEFSFVSTEKSVFHKFKRYVEKQKYIQSELINYVYDIVN